MKRLRACFVARTAAFLLAGFLVATIGSQAGAPVSVAPEIPRARVDTSVVPVSERVLSVPAGGDLQAALDAAQPGDVISLDVTATYEGPFMLPRKTGEGWIIIRGGTPNGVPPPGVRVKPSQSTAMPRLRASGGPVVTTARGAHHYRLVGLDIAPTPNTFIHDLVELGSGRESSEADLPHHLIIDRCYIHGDPIKGSRRGIALNARESAVIDSYLADFKEVGADSQALAGWNGPGPFKIVNNYLEGAGENLMFGGADPTIVNLVPSDIEIRGNQFAKPLSWRVGHRTYTGTHWSVKNLLELKNAQRILIDGNVFEYSWADAQVGYAVLFTVRNQNGKAPWSVVQDVTFTNNLVRHTASGLTMHGFDNYHPSQWTKRVLIANNLFDDVSGVTWGGEGKLFQILRGPSAVVIDHNTGIHTGNIITAEGEPAMDFVFTHNIAIHNAYGVIGTDHRPGLDTLRHYFPGAVFSGNLLVGAPLPAAYPSGTTFLDSMDKVEFQDAAGGDYRIAPSSPILRRGTSPVPGVDFRALGSAIGDLVSVPWRRTQ
jgi:hypothetical protein